MMLAWAISSLLFAIFIIRMAAAVPLQIQPLIFGFLAVASFLQTIFYSERKNAARLTIFLGFTCFTVSFICLVFGILYLGDDAIEGIGIASTVILLIGFVPQFYEIYILKRVQGISILFLFGDILGGVFSMLALAFAEGEYDWTAAAFYLGVVTCDFVIILLYPILPRVLRT